VFKNEAVKIHSGGTIERVLRASDYPPASQVLSTKVNHHIMPRIGHLNFETFEARHSCLKSYDIGQIIGLTGIPSLIIGLLVVFWCCWRKRGQKSLERSKHGQRGHLQINPNGQMKLNNHQSSVKLMKQSEKHWPNRFVDRQSFLELKDQGNVSRGLDMFENQSNWE